MKTQPKRHHASRMPMYGGWHDYQQWADHDFRPRASFDALAEAAEEEHVAAGRHAFEDEPADGGPEGSWDDYDQHGDYDQAGGYDRNGGYDQAEGYNQPGGYDQNTGYDHPEGYDQAGGYDQSGGYGQPEGYAQNTGYHQAGGYDQDGNWEAGDSWDDANGELGGAYAEEPRQQPGTWTDGYGVTPTAITVDPLHTGLPVRSEDPALSDPIPPGPAFVSTSTTDYLEWPDEDLPFDSPAAPMVRPYARTGGRTKSKYDLRLETLLTTVPDPGFGHRQLAGDHEQICRLCVVACSTAEVSAKLSIPLGVAKVLIGDVVDMGLVIIHDNDQVSDDRPSLLVMQRVLTGLQHL